MTEINESLTPEELVAIRARDAISAAFMYAAVDRRALLAEVDRLTKQLAERDAAITRALRHQHDPECDTITSQSTQICSCWYGELLPVYQPALDGVCQPEPKADGYCICEGKHERDCGIRAHRIAAGAGQ